MYNNNFLEIRTSSIAMLNEVIGKVCRPKGDGKTICYVVIIEKNMPHRLIPLDEYNGSIRLKRNGNEHVFKAFVPSKYLVVSEYVSHSGKTEVELISTKDNVISVKKFGNLLWLQEYLLDDNIKNNSMTVEEFFTLESAKFLVIANLLKLEKIERGIKLTIPNFLFLKEEEIYSDLDKLKNRVYELLDGLVCQLNSSKNNLIGGVI